MMRARYRPLNPDGFDHRHRPRRSIACVRGVSFDAGAWPRAFCPGIDTLADQCRCCGRAFQSSALDANEDDGQLLSAGHKVPRELAEIPSHRHAFKWHLHDWS